MSEFEANNPASPEQNHNFVELADETKLWELHAGLGSLFERAREGDRRFIRPLRKHHVQVGFKDDTAYFRYGSRWSDADYHTLSISIAGDTLTAHEEIATPLQDGKQVRTRDVTLGDHGTALWSVETSATMDRIGHFPYPGTEFREDHKGEVPTSYVDSLNNFANSIWDSAGIGVLGSIINKSL